MAYLTLLVDSREVRKFVLNPGITTIGRAQDNDIVINNLALSRRHAQVESVGNTFTVVDLKSQNGVFVNGERVKDKRVLSDKDSVALGTYQFVFRNDSEKRSPPRPSKPAPVRRGSSSSTQMLGKQAQAARAASARVPLLVLKYNDVELQRYPLKGSTCTIGRARDCDVQIAERRLSRRHCQLFRGDEGAHFLKDLNSQNGTYVNRRRIRGFHELRDGDVLNFAEYTIHFLSDLSEYRGPDAKNPAPGDTVMPPAVSPNTAMEAAETVMPEAYRDDYGYDDPGRLPRETRRKSSSAILPSELDEDPEASSQRPRMPVAMAPRQSARPVEPIIRSPREARKKPPKANGAPKRPSAERIRGVEVRAVESDRDDTSPPRRAPQKPKRRKKKRSTRPKKKSSMRAQPPEFQDVDDELGDPVHDASLEDWYAARIEQSRLFEVIAEEDDGDKEESMVLKDGPAHVSKVLSTMMVDRRELERNLRGDKARERKFTVKVKHGDNEIYAGLLKNQVTVMGTDPEADIQLKGRYVAGRHSLLVRVRDSLLLVRLGSSSAARVNGLPKLQAFLKSGDVIQIDETTIEIKEE